VVVEAGYRLSQGLQLAKPQFRPTRLSIRDYSYLSVCCKMYKENADLDLWYAAMQVYDTAEWFTGDSNW
jgi:hypothetical protein